MRHFTEHNHIGMVHSLPQVSKWEMAPCISMIYLRPRDWQTDIADMDVAVSVYYSLDKSIASVHYFWTIMTQQTSSRLQFSIPVYGGRYCVRTRRLLNTGMRRLFKLGHVQFSLSHQYGISDVDEISARIFLGRQYAQTVKRLCSTSQKLT